MTDKNDFSELLAEFTRVGVDPDGFPAGVDLTRDAALLALRALDDGAGPEAFLARIRGDQQARAIEATVSEGAAAD